MRSLLIEGKHYLVIIHEEGKDYEKSRNFKYLGKEDLFYVFKNLRNGKIEFVPVKNIKRMELREDFEEEYGYEK